MGLFKQVENETHIDHERWNDFRFCRSKNNMPILLQRQLQVFHVLFLQILLLFVPFLMSLEENLYTRKF